MICPQCGAENPQGSRYCHDCGALQPKRRIPWGAWFGVLALVLLAIASALLWPRIIASGPSPISADLEELAPSDCGFFLNLRSSDDPSLASTWTRISSSSFLRSSIAAALPQQGAELTVLIDDFFPMLEPSLQCAARWSTSGQTDWFAIGGIKDPQGFSARMESLSQRLEKLGIQCANLSAEDGSGWSWRDTHSWFFAQRQNLLFAASSEGGLRSLLQPSTSPHLRESPSFSQARQSYGKTPFFLFVNFVHIPSFPPQLHSLVLTAPSWESQIALRGECQVDLAGLLESPSLPPGLLQGGTSPLQPFSATPMGVAFALSGPGFLNQVIDYWILNGQLEQLPIDFQWLAGPTEVILQSSQDILDNLGFVVTLTPSQMEAGERELAKIESFASATEMITVDHQEIQGIPVVSLQVGESELFYTLTGTSFDLAFRFDTMDRLLQVRAGSASLAKDPLLVTALDGLADFPWVLYLDGSLFPEKSETLAPPVTTQGNSQEGKMVMGLRLQSDRIDLEGRLLISGTTTRTP